jgi:energy-coupling factor transporter ATP-binding protein EcfA2
MRLAAGPALSAERPFPGLRPYEYDDHPYFFGREDQTYGLYRLLDRSKFVAVVGSSGSGKSSLVNAGLLPLLQQETEGSGGRAWRWTKMRPGGSPLAALADAVMEFAPQDEQGAMAAALRDKIAFALRGSSFGVADALAAMQGLGDASVLLVVDQFEELFRYANLTGSGARGGEDSPGREEAAHFVQLLLEAGRDRARAVHVLITMRSDFIGDCARFQGLPEAVSGTQFLVPSLRRDQLKEVIRKPVEKVGGTIQPELVERLLNDCSTDLDQLPVLQHCLMRLWEHAGRGELASAGARHGR